MNINFRKAACDDVPNIVRLLADDPLGLNVKNMLTHCHRNTTQHLMKLIQIKIII